MIYDIGYIYIYIYTHICICIYIYIYIRPRKRHPTNFLFCGICVFFEEYEDSDAGVVEESSDAASTFLKCLRLVGHACFFLQKLAPIAVCHVLMSPEKGAAASWGSGGEAPGKI